LKINTLRGDPPAEALYSNTQQDAANDPSAGATTMTYADAFRNTRFHAKNPDYAPEPPDEDEAEDEDEEAAAP
jgi:hypothetical protein